MKTVFSLFIIGVSFSLLPLDLSAQAHTVKGEHIYYADPTVSPKEARRLAIENARVKTLAKEFGTFISQNTQQQILSRDGEEKDYFIQMNSLEVKGEWIEDIKEPEVVLVEQLPDGMQVLRAKVHGRAHPVSSEATEIEALILRNGTDLRMADVNFRHGDDAFLYFQSPLDGYVAVYLVDENANAYCLLPYENDPDKQQPVKADSAYIFFSPHHVTDTPKEDIDELRFTCEEEGMEHDQLYVIFSPRPFSRLIDKRVNSHASTAGEGWQTLQRQLDFRDFSRWLAKLSSREAQLGKKIVHITIRQTSK